MKWYCPLQTMCSLGSSKMWAVIFTVWISIQQSGACKITFLCQIVIHSVDAAISLSFKQVKHGLPELHSWNLFIYNQLTIIIEWGWVKYCDLSVVSRSIILLFAKAEGWGKELICETRMWYFACRKTVRHNSLSQKSHVTVSDKVFNFFFFFDKIFHFCVASCQHAHLWKKQLPRVQ